MRVLASKPVSPQQTLVESTTIREPKAVAGAVASLTGLPPDTPRQSRNGRVVWIACRPSLEPHAPEQATAAVTAAVLSAAAEWQASPSSTTSPFALLAQVH
jgi:hypothetical protein